jgi:hypothetical protein
LSSGPTTGRSTRAPAPGPSVWPEA